MTKKILIVDDEPDVLSLIKNRLEGNGYVTMTAVNGEDALAKIKAETPALIITDVLMPGMDGFAFYKEVRQNKATQQIPVIILTARSKMKDTFETFNVASFISKPFDSEKLLQEVKRFILPDAIGAAAPARTSPVREAVVVNAPPASVAEARKADVKAAMVFGSDKDILEDIARKLHEKKFEIRVLNNSDQISAEVERSCPELILLQANGISDIPIDGILATLIPLFSKQKASTEPGKKAREPIIVMYAVEEFGGVSSLAEQNADVESIVLRCRDVAGASVKSIGFYSPLSFFTQMQAYI